MKTQTLDFFRNLTVALSLAALAGGCANKNNVAENEQVDGYSETSQEVAENPAAPAEDAATDPAEAELFGEAKAENGAETANAETKGSDALFEPSSDANAEPNFEELAGTTTPDTSATAAATAPADTAALDLSTQSDPLAQSTTPSVETPKAFVEKPKSHSSGVASAPKIPGRAITRGGKSLNRYYFLRQGDTAKSVSTLLYGNPGFADVLKKQNKGGWSAGKVVYYASPSQPDDAQMISFYEEHNLTAENYTVRSGETMSTIAKAKLGSRSSWKEIAVTNGLSGSNSLKRGQTVRLYTDLRSDAPQMAQAPVAEEPVAQVAPQTGGQPAVAAVPGQDTQVPPAQDPIANDLNEVKKKPAKQPLNMGKLLSQNAFSIAVGLAVGLLLVSLLMINKRKKGGGDSGGEEFGEDAFSAPSKKKRS
ncbi:LysM peptidoglycan-binding domain-containing protein [bacterium]|nr:LysM peptidoglycan-binding domain-containing protein [bacterium]